jgi:hypothetical protein
MEQEEIAQENEDLINGEVVKEELKDEKEDETEIRKKMKYNVVFFLSLVLQP